MGRQLQWSAIEFDVCQQGWKTSPNSGIPAVIFVSAVQFLVLVHSPLYGFWEFEISLWCVYHMCIMSILVIINHIGICTHIICWLQVSNGASSAWMNNPSLFLLGGIGYMDQLTRASSKSIKDCIRPSSVHPQRVQREKFLIPWARSSSWWWSMYSNWKNPFSFFPSFNQKRMLIPVVQKPFKFKWQMSVRILLNPISSFEALWFVYTIIICRVNSNEN